MSADQPVRTNHDGHPCPPWCAVDHDKELFPGYHIKSHGAEGAVVGGVFIRASLGVTDVEPDVQVSVHDGTEGGSFYIAPGHAGYAASLLEHLATATPEQHRALAAAIRQAAAQITEAQR